MRGLRLVEILLAYHARRIESLGALILLLGPVQVRLLRCARAFLALDCGLLLERIDFHQRGAGVNRLARVDENFCDLTLHLRHNDGRIARFQRSHVFRGIVDRSRARLLHFHRHPGRPLGLSILRGIARARQGARARRQSTRRRLWAK